MFVNKRLGYMEKLFCIGACWFRSCFIWSPYRCLH